MLLKTGPIRRRKAEPQMGILINALSYRIPFPVREVVRYINQGCYPLCPRCKCSLEREYMNFCDRCGQRLSWAVLSHAKVRSWGR